MGSNFLAFKPSRLVAKVLPALLSSKCRKSLEVPPPNDVISADLGWTLSAVGERRLQTRETVPSVSMENTSENEPPHQKRRVRRRSQPRHSRKLKKLVPSVVFRLALVPKWQWAGSFPWKPSKNSLLALLEVSHPMCYTHSTPNQSINQSRRGPRPKTVSQFPLLAGKWKLDGHGRA